MKPKFAQAVILCGGEGTRLGNITKKTPKPLIKVNSKSFLNYQIDHLKKFGFKKFLLLCGYKSEKFIKHFKKNKDVKIIVENQKLNTGGALINAKKNLDKNFLLFNGDTFSDINFNFFIDYHKKNKFRNSILINYTNTLNRYGKVKIKKKSNLVLKISKNIRSKYIYSGFCLLNKNFIKNIKCQKKSFEDLVAKYLIKKNQLNYIISNNASNFIDIGVKKDLNNSSNLLKKSLDRKIVFFDRDGTINKDTKYLYRKSDFIWNKSFFKTVRYLNSKNILVFVITNQSGVGRGFYKENSVIKLHKWMNEVLISKKAYIDDFFYAIYFHNSTKFNFKKKDLYRRKPNIGMVLEAKKKWGLNIKKSIIIGDSASDKLLANKLNVKFYKVNYKTDLLKIVKKKFN